MPEGADSEAMSTQRHNEIMELLTAAQKPKYEAYLEESSQRRQSRSSGESDNGDDNSRRMDSSQIIESRVSSLTENFIAYSRTSNQSKKLFMKKR